jgi:hypothetical protein
VIGERLDYRLIFGRRAREIDVSGDGAMRQTKLSGRQIQAVVLVFVIFMGGMFAYVSTVLPSSSDPVGSRRTALVSGIVAALATVWFVKLMIDSVQDRRRGISNSPAKVSGKFNIYFGAAVVLGGIICSALTYWSAITAGGGIWTIYYGMIGWGLAQMFIGYMKLGKAKA